MRDVVVRMEMPKSCKKCKSTLCLWTIDDCEIINTITAVQDFRKENDDGFPEFCPIICALPENHGRLIDASTIIGEVDAGYTDEYGNPMPVNRPVSVDEYLGLEVPTIVPAERREE